jgi:hypothetical protein
MARLPYISGGIEKLKFQRQQRRWLREIRSEAQLAERVARLRQDVQTRLADPRRTPPVEPPLNLLKEVGLAQISMQMTGYEILVTQAAGVLAGAGILAAADIAVEGFLLVLLLALASSGCALRALLGGGLNTGPTPFQILEVRNIFHEPGQHFVLEDAEVDWLLVGDIEAAMRTNQRAIRPRSRWLAGAAWLLVIGIAVLSVQQIVVAARDANAQQPKTGSRYNQRHVEAAGRGRLGPRGQTGLVQGVAVETKPRGSAGSIGPSE